MSCDVAMTSAAILFAAFHAAPAPVSSAAPPRLEWIATATAVAVENPLAREPLYADIVGRATALKGEVAAYRAGPPTAAPAALPGFDRFKADIGALSALDMQGHFDLAKRGTDGDLKCILKGISQDLPRKLTELEQAATPDARSAALQDMFYLLRDNVEVITSPPAPTV
jgi:hypothetical protein